MTDKETNQDLNTGGLAEAITAEDFNAVEDLFDGMFSPSLQDKPEEGKSSAKKPAESSEDENSQNKKEDKNTEKQSKKDNESDEEDKGDEDKYNLAREVNTLRKRLSDSQRYGRENAEKLKAAINKINEYIQSDEISEEEGATILSLLNHGKDPNEDQEETNPFQKFFNLTTQDVVKSYLDVTDDQDFNKKVNAFDSFLVEASPEELDYLYKELEQVKDSPVRLLKKMLLVGENMLKEGYNDLFSAGGFRKYSSSKQKEIETLQNKIDRLEKKLTKYESEGKPTYSISEMTDSESSENANDDFFDGMFAMKSPYSK